MWCKVEWSEPSATPCSPSAERVSPGSLASAWRSSSSSSTWDRCRLSQGICEASADTPGSTGQKNECRIKVIAALYLNSCATCSPACPGPGRTRPCSRWPARQRAASRAAPHTESESPTESRRTPTRHWPWWTYPEKTENHTQFTRLLIVVDAMGP